MSTRRKNSLLEINGLKTYFFTDEGIARAVDDVFFTLKEGETLGLVGESGCGKSVTALSIMRLIPEPPGKIVKGEIIYGGNRDLVKCTESEMMKIRGKEISMIFQEPMTSLNPVLRVGKQVSEMILRHEKVSRKEAMERTVEMLKMVGIPSPEKRIRDYPHQLSGGMRQRVMIAMALSCNPKLMLADEPTTALDVTIQAQILDLMNKLKEAIGTSIVLITHDLGVIAEMANNVCVMYAGVIVESADVQTIFKEPLHPYTNGLLTSIPPPRKDPVERDPLNTIPGIVPSLLDLPAGCRFRDRCNHAHEPCEHSEPPLLSPEKNSSDGHLVRCWLHLATPS